MVHTLYLATAGSASLDIRDDGRITGIYLACVDAAAGAAEVSFGSTAQLATNDTTGVLAGMPLPGLANGLAIASVHCDEPVQAGERLYLHVTGALNITRAFIYTDTKGSRPSVRRR